MGIGLATDKGTDRGQSVGYLSVWRDMVRALSCTSSSLVS
jgi:hypothetical protein